ncbi:hypothetical protein [Xanthomarina sp. F2636L]|uniref:hypothetical protein n=1 Tax=Xanthomarina sp. F2636L TaxID=2996018 RepID=UPI00225E32DF|nr:hypothetical protein [Xanthomarina sp. F2636L]MCX7549853.1 hypothetical protein [Xanthomarina sp. F2636L]
MTISKKLFGALLFTAFLGFSQLSSAQTSESSQAKTEKQAKAQEQSQYQETSEVKEDKTDLKTREEKAVENKATKEEETDNDKK